MFKGNSIQYFFGHTRILLIAWTNEESVNSDVPAKLVIVTFAIVVY